MVLSGPAASALAAVEARYHLPQRAMEQLAGLADLLAHDPLAPTAVRDPERVVEEHIADALVALDLEPVRLARYVVDLGSGPGVPGLPLAISRPDATVVLLESNRRKADFIARAARICGIRNGEVAATRAESWKAGIATCDLVTARAVARLDVVAEYAAPLLRVGGALVAWRGKREPEVEAQATSAAHVLGLAVVDPVRVVPFPGVRERHLHVMVKVMETPLRFPRRPGVAAKHPLGHTSGSDREGQ